MGYSLFVNGELTERGDDQTRAVYDGQGAKIRDYTEAENQAAYAAQEAEARLVSIEDRLARIEAKLWPAEPDPADTTGVPTWADHGGIAPAGALVLDGGKVWRNVSGVPLTHPPSGFPGWTVAQLAHLWDRLDQAAKAARPSP